MSRDKPLTQTTCSSSGQDGSATNTENNQLKFDLCFVHY